MKAWHYGVLPLLAALWPLAALGGQACDDPGAIPQSAVVNIGAATTTKIVDSPGARQQIHVCGFVATLAGTTPTIQFVTGTHVSADCDTGATNLSGAMAPVAGQPMSGGFGGDLMVSPAGNQLCGTTTGSGSSFQGVLSYVVTVR